MVEEEIAAAPQFTRKLFNVSNKTEGSSVKLEAQVDYLDARQFCFSGPTTKVGFLNPIPRELCFSQHLFLQSIFLSLNIFFFLCGLSFFLNGPTIKKKSDPVRGFCLFANYISLIDLFNLVDPYLRLQHEDRVVQGRQAHHSQLKEQ